MRSLASLSRPEPVLVALWLMEIVQLAWSPPELRRAAGLLLIAYVVLAAARLRRSIAVEWLAVCAILLATATLTTIQHPPG